MWGGGGARERLGQGERDESGGGGAAAGVLVGALSCRVEVGVV